MWEWFKKRLCGNGNEMTVEQKRQDRRSRVRVAVTYWAALYIFGGSAALIVLALYGKLNTGNFDVVREIFTMTLPIATGVVTYWFATRQRGQADDTQQSEVSSTDQPNQTDATQKAAAEE